MYVIPQHKALLFPASFFTATPDTGENAVLPKSPEQLIDSTARIPLMFGMCEREAVMGFTSMSFGFNKLTNSLFFHIHSTFHARTV